MSLKRKIYIVEKKEKDFELLYTINFDYKIIREISLSGIKEISIKNGHFIA